MIYLITYDASHRKTQEILFRAKARGFTDFKVIGTPWVDKPKTFKPLIPHRPTNSIPVSMAEFCKNLGYSYEIVDLDKTGEFLVKNNAKLLLIGAAGILGPEIINACTVINSHPAYLPYVRGLDALKWAIYDGKPIGVTLHIASEEADSGWLIQREIIPVYSWDSFHSVAYRQFEKEMDFIVDAIELYQQGKLNDRSKLEVLTTGESPAHRRMPHSIEMRLMKRFQNLVDNVPIEINPT